MRAIFVSYRRDDSEGEAGRLFDDLVQAFGEASIFMDVAGIEAGRDFRKAIDESVTNCGVLLALIGKRWVDARNEAGLRRLDDPYDFVRLETASALKRDIPVIPVLVGGATMPRADQLPEDLKELVFRNAVELTHARWNSDLQLLIKALRPHVGGSANVPIAQRQAAAGTAAVSTATAPVGSAASSPGLEAAPAARKRPIRLIVGGLAAVLAIGAVAAYMMMPKQVTVPDLIGSTLPNAAAKLQALQLAVGQTTPKDDATKDPNTVLSQSPSANSTVKRGTSVNLVISQKPQSSATVEVPSLLGKSLDAATQALEDRQLTLGNIAPDSGSDKPKDTVLDQFPRSGQKAQLGARVDLKVATGKTTTERPPTSHPLVTQPPATTAQSPASPQTQATVEIPSLVGKSLDAAKQALEDRQLTLGNVATDTGSEKSKDTVLEQFPSAGQKAQLGAKVDLKVAAAQPAAERSSAPQTAPPQNSPSGQQLGSSAPPIFADRLVGVWTNLTPRPDSIKRIEFARVGRNLDAHLWYTCPSGDCDVGRCPVTISGAVPGFQYNSNDRHRVGTLNLHTANVLLLAMDISAPSTGEYWHHNWVMIKSTLPEKGQGNFRQYFGLPPHKAFALAPSGSYAYQFNDRSLDHAQEVALKLCEKMGVPGCRVILIDDDAK